MLTTEQREALNKAAEPKVPTCQCPSAEGGFSTLPGTTLAVHTPCGRPTQRAAQILGHVYAKHLTAEAVANAKDATLLVVPAPKAEAVEVADLAPVTTINGVEVDLRGEGRFQTACADCQTPLEVEVAPEGVDLDLLTSMPRVAVCQPCGEVRLAGKRGVVIYTHEAKEIELDLTKYSKAEFAALAEDARQRAIAEAEAALPAKREAAMQAKAEADAQERTLKLEERAKFGKRKTWMGPFTIYRPTGKGQFDRTNGRDVPALDFTEVELDELVPAKVRSPYNKALYLLGEPLLEKEETTFRVLRKVHKRLWKHADVAYDLPKPVAEPKPEAPVLLAQIDPEADAKVAALAKVTGLSLDQARERLASLSLI
jgi:hypothetical protein